MKQIITQHGWGLDRSFWDIYKIEFQKNSWNWQDNERGYFSINPIQHKWIKNNLNNQIKMILCHSLGSHLIEKTLLNQNFVIDPDKTIKQVLNNKNNNILDYVRFEVGEGIEKNTEDFADEVMKTISN